VNYPAWEVRVNGKDVKAETAEMTGQMLVPLPPGGHQVEVRFRRTWDRATGDAISLLSALGLMVYAWSARKRIGGSANFPATFGATVT
jgi:hypothetical protein